MNQLITALNQFKEKNILLLGHKNADPDSVCSIIALSNGLKKLGLKTRCGAVESVSTISRKIINELGEEIEINPELNADLVVLLDMSTEGQLSNFAKKIIETKAKKMIIDHHATHGYTLKADFSLIDEKATSTAKLVYRLLNELKTEIDEKIAKAVLLGIVAETAHLQYATIEDFELISALMKKFGINYQYLISVLGTPMDVSEKIARLKAAQRVKFERVKEFILATSEITSFEASAARLLIRAGADFAAVAAKKEDEVRISLRSTQSFFEKTKIDLGKEIAPKIAAIVGGTGSGHPTAAGVNGKLVSKTDEALKYIAKHVKDVLAK